MMSLVLIAFFCISGSAANWVTQGYIGRFSAVKFMAEFTDVNHALHYVPDYVLSILFSSKYEIFGV